MTKRAQRIIMECHLIIDHNAFLNVSGPINRNGKNTNMNRINKQLNANENSYGGQSKQHNIKKVILIKPSIN